MCGQESPRPLTLSRARVRQQGAPEGRGREEKNRQESWMDTRRAEHRRVPGRPVIPDRAGSSGDRRRRAHDSAPARGRCARSSSRPTCGQLNCAPPNRCEAHRGRACIRNPKRRRPRPAEGGQPSRAAATTERTAPEGAGKRHRVMDYSPLNCKEATIKPSVLHAVQPAKTS
jgi:hypothetical protein